MIKDFFLAMFCAFGAGESFAFILAAKHENMDPTPFVLLLIVLGIAAVWLFANGASKSK